MSPTTGLSIFACVLWNAETNAKIAGAPSRWPLAWRCSSRCRRFTALTACPRSRRTVRVAKAGAASQRWAEPEDQERTYPR